MKWLLFDYGEVLCHAQPEADRERMVAASEVEATAFWERYWEHRLDFDRGTLTPAAYWSLVLGGRPSRDRVERLVELDVQSWSHPDDDAVAVMEEVHALGHPVALLSNAPLCVAEGIERLPWIQTMNARFYSARLGMVKPDAEIYLRVASELGAEPEDFVFVDDRLANVAGAEAVGMTAIHHRGAESLRDDLKPALASPR
ncbi:HAD family phosphatase [Sphaerisporangium sp. TRM90804]|uniref:HAD family hydrolase n=1 Tax=Sphaerisporangium sp. TRM90804 TaxID=3031113 RepID=UPI00244BDB51|nr:HAD family phosphatase [Sphaerisporangium sp. TRM90804]MDH2429606.1 HAD family phosphatase [Sphaerisporangium sp. TRM90804]